MIIAKAKCSCAREACKHSFFIDILAVQGNDLKDEVQQAELFVDRLRGEPFNIVNQQPVCPACGNLITTTPFRVWEKSKFTVFYRVQCQCNGCRGRNTDLKMQLFTTPAA